jgi:DNA-binding response OmpR family regulator
MKRLLLVDDDAVATRAYRDRLSAHGFQVNTASSAAMALSILRSAKPDMVVLDLMMPEVSGVEVLKFIRSEARLAHTPVVVLANAYLNDLGRQAARVGIEKAFLSANGCYR